MCCRACFSPATCTASCFIVYIGSAFDHPVQAKLSSPACALAPHMAGQLVVAPQPTNTHPPPMLP